ncbi:MAG: hypothetical protein AB8F34_01245 [Akkermansiaceae bacterium]
MPHSYEEIRSATLDVLAKRVTTQYDADQYAHLKIGVGKALRNRDGQPEPAPSVCPADSSLDHADADLFLEVFWDLFRDGVITLGLNDSNKEFPFFRVTTRGRHLMEGGGEYFLHDVSGFERQIKAEIPDIDPTTLLYLKEALQAFRSGCILASTVMLGVATEHTFLLLMEAINQSKTHSATFSSVSKERGILRKINKFKNIFEQNKKSVPRELVEDFDTHFLGIQSLIRGFRNESGHPSGKIIEREQSFVNLQLFVSYGRKAYQFINYYSK